MMPKHRNAKIIVKNFGPIKEGEFDLKPLTIFIGPNNSGKSYMALLVYALSQALATRHQGMTLRYGLSYTALGRDRRSIEQADPELTTWLTEKLGTRARVAKFRDFPKILQQALQNQLQEYISTVAAEVEISLRDYFAYEEIKELVLLRNGSGALTVEIVNTKLDPLLTVQVSIEDGKCRVDIPLPKLNTYQVALADLRRYPLLPELMGSLLVNDVWLKHLKSYGFPNSSAYYLPSARSGILQGWQIYASMALRVVRSRLGFERIELPRLPGVAGDFLEILWDRLFAFSRRQRERPLQPALELLESEIFRGRVSFEETRPEQPLILYKSGPVEVPLQRASSMIAELAPLDLWLKYLLRPEDLLIIDEPEAHLHPENQRLLARLLVRLVRTEVGVVCPTHSSLILHQLSNQILAAQLDPETREKQGLQYTADDLIKSEEVGVYLFDVQEDGTHILPVPVDAEIGISEDEFLRVAESIGDETYKLTVAVLEKD